MQPGDDHRPVEPQAERPGLGELVRVFLRISLLGFGGPNAHIALMLDEVVERRRWMSRERFLELVAVTNLLPGPNSSEVAIHVGHTQRGVRGGLAAGLAFLLPTFVIVLALSALYFRFGRLPAVAGLFWGVQPMIVAVVLVAGWKLARTAVGDAGTQVLAVAGVAAALFASGLEVLAIGVGALAGWVLYGRHHTSAPPGGPRGAPGARGAPVFIVLAPFLASGDAGQLGRLLWTTFWTGSVLFGGGYMLIALLEPVVVAQQAWLTQQQFLDGIALTQAAPGPIVMLVTFVGYAVAGVPGAAIATVGIYVPSFAAVFLAAPLLERWRAHAAVRATLRGVNAVVCGAIIGAALRLLAPAVPDAVAALLLVAGVAAQLRLGVSAAWLVLAGLLAGALRQLAAG